MGASSKQLRKQIKAVSLFTNSARIPIKNGVR